MSPFFWLANEVPRLWIWLDEGSENNTRVEILMVYIYICQSIMLYMSCQMNADLMILMIWGIIYITMDSTPRAKIIIPPLYLPLIYGPSLQAFTTGGSRVGGRRRESAQASEAVAAAGNGLVAVWLTSRHEPAVFYFSLFQTLFLPFPSPFRIFFLFYSKIFKSKLIKYVVYGVNKYYFVSWAKVVSCAM